MKNRLKWFFDQETKPVEIPVVAPNTSEDWKDADLSKIIAILNKCLAPHVQAEMVGDEAVIRCGNKTVWIDSHCLVVGESFTP